MKDIAVTVLDEVVHASLVEHEIRLIAGNTLIIELRQQGFGFVFVPYAGVDNDQRKHQQKQQ